MTITYQVESWEKFSRDVQGLWRVHHREVARDKYGLEPSPDLTRFRLLEGLGQLLILTARHDGEIIGYFVIVLARHPHYNILVGYEDMHFLLPAYRQGLKTPWTRMLSLVKQVCKAKGCYSLSVHSKPGVNRVGELLGRLGFSRSDEIWTEVL